MASNDGLSDPSFFELEREKLIQQVSENLASLISSANTLNRNVEANIAVGSQFDGVSRLWKEYGRVMAHSGNEQLPTSLPPPAAMQDHGDEPIQDPLEVQEDSFGLPPGAGSTSYMH